MRRRLPVLVGLLAFAAGAACSRGGGQEAARLSVEGRAEVGAPGEDLADVTGGRVLRFGQRVRVREGTAVVRLRDDRSLELRAGSQMELQAVTVAGRRSARPVLLAGDVLVVAPTSPLTVSSAGTDVLVRGTARVSRGLSVIVEAYAGGAELSSVGRSALVPALREVAVPAVGLFPARPSPLEYSASDPWDRRFLSDAIELGNELAARSQGFSAQLGPDEGRTADFFRRLLPGLGTQPSFTPSLLGAARPPGETLVGAAITLEGQRSTFAERWTAVFAFRDDGAPWGLVALDQGVARAPLLATVDAAIDRGPSLFSVAPAGGSRPPVTVRSGPTPTVPGAPSGAEPPPTPPHPNGSAPQAPGPPGPGGTGPLNTGVPLLDDTVNALVEALSGLLRSLGLG